jgi:hypothetical protein
MDLILISIIVLITAAVFSMFGLGGGIVYVPVLYLLGVPIETAVPTGLFLNIMTSMSASYSYFKSKLIDFQFAFPLIVSSVPGALLGAYLIRFFDIKLILILFMMFLVFAGLSMMFKRNEGDIPEIHAGKSIKIISGFAFGFIAGIISGIIGIGGGVLIVPALICLFKVNAKISAATASFVVIFSSASGFLGHILLSEFDFTIALLTGVFALVGGQIGARLMIHKFAEDLIRKLFGGVLIIIALRLFADLI